MKLVLDMNLPPSWVERLAGHGLECIHWSRIGAASAPDRTILEWAREHGFVLVTHDLGFSAVLAATGDRSPSVIQIRGLDLLAAATVATVATAVNAHADSIARGALLSIDDRRARVRILPLRERT